MLLLFFVVVAVDVDGNVNMDGDVTHGMNAQAILLLCAVICRLRVVVQLTALQEAGQTAFVARWGITVTTEFRW